MDLERSWQLETHCHSGHYPVHFKGTDEPGRQPPHGPAATKVHPHRRNHHLVLLEVKQRGLVPQGSHKRGHTVASCTSIPPMEGKCSKSQGCELPYTSAYSQASGWLSPFGPCIENGNLTKGSQSISHIFVSHHFAVIANETPIEIS